VLGHGVGVLGQESLQLLSGAVLLDRREHRGQIHADVAAEMTQRHLVAIGPDDAGCAARATKSARVGERIASRASLHRALVVVARRAGSVDTTVIWRHILNASEVEAGVAIAGLAAVIVRLARSAAGSPCATVTGARVAAVGGQPALRAVSAVTTALNSGAFPAGA